MEGEIKKRILIIDDDKDIRQLLVHMLTKQSYIIIEACDGLDGLEKLKSESPDMVMVDVMMPRMNGFEFCEEASRLNSKKHIPIIIMTAQDDQDSVNLAYDKGATDFITKPINKAKLIHRVQFSLRASETTEKLANRERQLLSAQKIAKMGEWIYDRGKNEFLFSDEVANIFGVDKKQKLSYENLMKFVDSDDVDRVCGFIDGSTLDNQDYSVEYTINTKAGKAKRIRQIIDVEVNDPEKVFGVFQDISVLRNAEKKVNTLSFYDSVTGLPNRQFFKRILKKTIASSKRNNRQFALLDINLDRFMRINTTLGHDIGDNLLVAASQRLSQVIRESDTSIAEGEKSLFTSGMLAHFSGDDFMILLNDINNADDAAKVARQINSLFEKSFEISGKEVHMTTSTGIGVYPDDGENVEDLLKKVSVALHNAKETGRNCYRFYTESMNILSSQHLAMETDLRKALKEEQFELYYQPKVSLIDGSITGAEALIRWNHPTMGLVSPADFIPIAESNGLIVSITDWVIAEACRQLSTWDKKNFELESVSINITPASLLDKNINEHVFKHLRLADVEASRLEFEITESVLMEDVEVVLPILHELKSLGSKISIDDFGTGYSSLSYLKGLPISKLKIDQSFIRDLIHHKDGATIVNAIISLSHNLGFRVIAEGVEEKEQLEYLREHDCDVVQGYFYARPLPADEFFQWAMKYESEQLENEPEIMTG
jgi:diguanylate cyclase (GGDEF)-like protein